MSALRPIKRLARRAMNAAGYDIVRPAYGIHDNSWTAQKHLAPGATTILDVGANLGQSAVQYKAMFPHARVVCFEPFAETYAALLERARTLVNVDAHNLAVAARPGRQKLFVNRRSSTNSLLPVAAGAGRYVAESQMRPRLEVDVDCTSVDAFCASERLETVDILKIDVQGTEGDVLRGAEGMLASAAIGLVYAEVFFARLYEGQAMFCDIDDHLRGAGYELYSLFDLNFGRNGMLAWADALYLSPAQLRRLA